MTDKPELMTERELADLQEIRRLIDEAYDHYFEHSDGYCKSGEGHISVDFGNYFERRNGERERQVVIYSYVLGPSRSHSFPTIRAALHEVQKWHREEMATGYEALGREMYESLTVDEIDFTQES